MRSGWHHRCVTTEAGDEQVANGDASKLLDAAVNAMPGAHHRTQQQQMAELVAQAVDSRQPLIVQAGTGTGKSMAYLCGGLASGARFVVSTATRQLSDQLVEADVPVVVEAARTVLNRRPDAVTLKGRANYICLAKIDEIRSLDSGPPAVESVELDLGIDPVEVSPVQAPSSPEAKEIRSIFEWLDDDPDSADRTDAPTVSDRVWSSVSMDSTNCPGARHCRFGDDCYAELARGLAREADIVVTNHALLAADLASPSPLLADHDLIVVDEVHEVEGYLSSAWGHDLYAGAVDRVLREARRHLPKDADLASSALDSAIKDADALQAALFDLPGERFTGSLPADIQGPLISLHGHLDSWLALTEKTVKQLSEDKANGLAASRTAISDLRDTISSVVTDDPHIVRWSVEGRDETPASLRAEPLSVAQRFRTLVGERALVATSATASVAGDFAPVAHTLGLDLDPESPTSARDDDRWLGVDVGSPFDYPRQGILYVPREIPEPVGKERAEHSAAVLDELTELVEAAGGRTLALFTTAYAARQAGDHLRRRVGVEVLVHGETSGADLAEQFAKDETSVLCATMGMWAGLNVPGPSCSLVVIDKIPFVPMNDPIAQARREHVDGQGRNGFGEVFVGHAALMLTQGVGRLIRTPDDKGVVAILDPRLHTKGYGRALLASLPPMWRTDDPKTARDALRRLADEAS